MIYGYPCEVASDENGRLVAAFPDVPEAITGGRNRAETLRLAADALGAALAGYVHGRRDIPQPSTASPDQELSAAPAVMTAKLALYSAMRSQSITESELARRLGTRPSAARRLGTRPSAARRLGTRPSAARRLGPRRSAARKLTDPDHQSRIGQLQEALDAVDCRVVIDVTTA